MGFLEEVLVLEEVLAHFGGGFGGWVSEMCTMHAPDSQVMADALIMPTMHATGNLRQKIKQKYHGCHEACWAFFFMADFYCVVFSRVFDLDILCVVLLVGVPPDACVAFAMFCGVFFRECRLS